MLWVYAFVSSPHEYYCVGYKGGEKDAYTGKDRTEVITNKE